MCRVEGTEFNLSQESLTSREVLQQLKKIQREKPALHQDIQDEPSTSSFIGVPENDPFAGEIHDNELEGSDDAPEEHP